MNCPYCNSRQERIRTATDRTRYGCGTTHDLRARTYTRSNVCFFREQAYRGVPPDVLSDALQDPVHKDVGKSRPAKVVKTKGKVNE